MTGRPARFWDFTLALYGKPGVAPALIALQDRIGADVNLLIYCCWAASRGVALTDPEVRDAVRAAEPWQAEIVRVLRALRRKLKGGFPGLPAADVEGLRKQINQAEIEGERISQTALEALLPGRPAAALADGAVAAIAVANLSTYFAVIGRILDEADSRDLKAVISAGFGAADRNA